MTGIPALLAATIAFPTASESVGLIRIKSTPWVNKSSILDNSFAASFCESNTINSTPISSALASAPSFNVTKNGLFKVERIKPIFLSSCTIGISLVINLSATGTNVSNVSPAITLLAASTPNDPINDGCCATVAAIFPSSTDLTASSVASNPTTIISLPDTSTAFNAPNAISSLWANTASISGCDCKMFSITERPFVLSKSATWLATTSIEEAPTASLNPWPLSLAAEVPAIPSSSTTLPAPPRSSTINSPAITPPATLSEAIWVTTSPAFVPRSKVITGISFAFAALIAFPTASESVGLIKMTFTPWVNRSSIFESSKAASFCESNTTNSKPNSLAFASAPSFNVTKNGLLSVDTIKPILPLSPAASVSSLGWQPANTDTIINITSISANIFFIIVLPVNYKYIIMSMT